jgi:hypothetical protein
MLVVYGIKFILQIMSQVLDISHRLILFPWQHLPVQGLSSDMGVDDAYNGRRQQRDNNK